MAYTYKVKQLIDKGLDVKKLDAKLQKRVELIKKASKDFTKESETAVKADGMVVTLIKAKHADLIPSDKPKKKVVVKPKAEKKPAPKAKKPAPAKKRSSKSATDKINDCVEVLKQAHYDVIKKQTKKKGKKITISRKEPRQDRVIIKDKANAVFKTIEKDLSKKDDKQAEMIKKLDSFKSMVFDFFNSLDKIVNKGTPEQLDKVIAGFETLLKGVPAQKFASGGEVDDEVTYDVYGYSTSSDWDGRNFTILDDGITSKSEALNIGRDFLDEYVVVKVQSSDREEIELLGDEATYGGSTYAKGGEVKKGETVRITYAIYPDGDKNLHKDISSDHIYWLMDSVKDGWMDFFGTRLSPKDRRLLEKFALKNSAKEDSQSLKTLYALEDKIERLEKELDTAGSRKSAIVLKLCSANETKSEYLKNLSNPDVLRYLQKHDIPLDEYLSFGRFGIESGDVPMFAKGGRIKSAIARDRKYTSEEEHEKRYSKHRKSPVIGYKGKKK